MLPAASAVQMAEAILKAENRVLPCTAYLEGEFGARDIFIGVPVILGATGLEKVIEVNLNEEEQKQFDYSVNAVKTLISKLSSL